VSIEIPPLRRRPEDIPLLVERLLDEHRAKHPRSPVERFSGDAMGKLLQHRWPGNVRELAHAVERVVLFGRAAEATLADLPPTITSPSTPPLASASEVFSCPPGSVLPVRELQRRYAVWALERFDGHKTRTAEALGIDGKTLARWLEG
jgi:two-component system response regulator HydG